MTRSRRCSGPSDRDPLLPPGLRPRAAHLQRRSPAAEPGRGAGAGSRLLPRDPVGGPARGRSAAGSGPSPGTLPWYLRDIALPGASATVLSAIRVEGRTFHLAAHALVRYWIGPRRLAGARRLRGCGRALVPGGDRDAPGRVRQPHASPSLHGAGRCAACRSSTSVGDGRCEQGPSGWRDRDCVRALTLRQPAGRSRAGARVR